MDFEKCTVVDECFARCGLMGNPSDGFNGKTISFLFRNFSAVVTVEPHDGVLLVPNAEHDQSSFRSLLDLHRHTAVKGYYGGLRLLLATCKVFSNHCVETGLENRVREGFKLSYVTTIPRMVGLSGSSALVCATFRALMKYYKLTLEDMQISKEAFPNVILHIEKTELGISAGLQDRIIQTYGGLVHMDFSDSANGVYSEIDLSTLPRFYLLYNTAAGGDSGTVHSTVKDRWANRDAELVSGMATLGNYADLAVESLHRRDYAELGRLMDKNFLMRRRLYGDDVVGVTNIAAIELANKMGFSAKFTGSGGAILCLHREVFTEWLDEAVEENLNKIFMEIVNFAFVRVQI